MSELVESFSGLRGIFGDTLTLKILKNYFLAYRESLLKKKKTPLVVVGMDTRVSGPAIKDLFCRCFENVIDLGVNTTPMIELAVREYKADGGIIITGSHNPAMYNGIKFLRNNGEILRAEEMAMLILDAKKEFSLPAIKTAKINKHEDMKTRYIDFVKQIYGQTTIDEIKQQNFRILADPNGGAGIIILKELFVGLLNVGVIMVNSELGKFKRLIEPNVSSLKYLGPLVEKYNADFAIGLDCDADRLEIVMAKDGKTEMVSGNYVGALALKGYMERHEKSKRIHPLVVMNDATSNLVTEVGYAYEAKIREVEVGETNVITAMYTEENTHRLVFGCEGSNGGVIIPPSNCRDGLLAVIDILSLMAKQKKSLQQAIDDLPRYVTTQRRGIWKKDPKQIKKDLIEFFKNDTETISRTGDESGGLKITLKDSSFVWFRMSKTEANIGRIIVDSKSKERHDYLINKAEEIAKE